MFELKKNFEYLFLFLVPDDRYFFFAPENNKLPSAS